MKTQVFSYSCSIEKKIRARSLNASLYYQFQDAPKQLVSQTSIINAEKDKQRRLRFHQRTVLMDKHIQKDKKQQQKRVFREKMFEINESQQRRLSCHCNECGKITNKMNKFHNILLKSVKPIKEFRSSSNLQTQKQSLLTVSTKSLKSTTTLLSITDTSPQKIRRKVESPVQKKQNSHYKLISVPFFKYKTISLGKIPLKTNSTQLTLRPLSLRASAPNLETFEYSSKQSSPRRGQSNYNIKQDIQVLTQRNFSKQMMQSCYLKTFSSIHIRNTIQSKNKEIKY